jgi:hypothetical protein
MTRKEMLEKSGLTEDEFQDLVQKFVAFHHSLNTPQRDAIERSLPTVAEAAATFGPGVTAEHLGKAIGIELKRGGTFVSERSVGLSAKAR